ncbi:MAG TPA: hypothetical protein VIM43_09790 [Rugosibacter sp.]
MKKINSLTLVVGTAFATTVLTTAAFAGSNPFAMQKLGSGYQLAAADTDKKMDGSCGDKMKVEKSGEKMKKKDGKCGEGKFGANKKKMHDGKCGADKMKDGSGGADKKKDGSCGAGKKMEEPTGKTMEKPLETPKAEEAK